MILSDTRVLGPRKLHLLLGLTRPSPSSASPDKQYAFCTLEPNNLLPPDDTDRDPTSYHLGYEAVHECRGPVTVAVKTPTCGH